MAAVKSGVRVGSQVYTETENNSSASRSYPSDNFGLVENRTEQSRKGKIEARIRTCRTTQNL